MVESGLASGHIHMALVMASFNVNPSFAKYIDLIKLYGGHSRDQFPISSLFQCLAFFGTLRVRKNHENR